MAIPFNRPHISGHELRYIEEAIALGHISGDGLFTKRANAWLEKRLGVPRALLTHSCTAALEMCAILAEIRPGDEIVMPSFTFVSTANAFVLRGGVPVFVDVRADTLNVDERLVEAAITPKTRAIVAVHYAGVACDMDPLLRIAKAHDLWLIEDAAQALLADYRGRPLGSIGHMAAFSFHETKNLISGEGGALVLNDRRFIGRAEVVREKGTNRSRFLRGEVEKYSWVDVGSSYLPSDIIAAFLWAQFESADRLRAERLRMWHRYHDGFADFEAGGAGRRPIVPDYAGHNGHLYYLLLDSPKRRTALLAALRAEGIHAIFHYVPLHSSPAGRKYGRAAGDLQLTQDLSERVIRLPLFYDLRAETIDRIIETVYRSEIGKRPTAKRAKTYEPASQ